MSWIRMRFVRLPFAVVATALVLSCGGEDAQDGARDAVVGLQEAFAENDLRRACGLMTAGARRHVGGIGHGPLKPCPVALRMFADFLFQGREGQAAVWPEIRRVEVDGDSGKVTIAGPDGLQSVVPVAREGGEWKVAAIYGDVPGSRQLDKF